MTHLKLAIRQLEQLKTGESCVRLLGLYQKPGPTVGSFEGMAMRPKTLVKHLELAVCQ